MIKVSLFQQQPALWRDDDCYSSIEMDINYSLLFSLFYIKIDCPVNKNLVRGQKNEAAWETKFQRIDTKMHKKNYYFYILKQQYECQTLMTQLFKTP